MLQPSSSSELLNMSLRYSATFL